MIYNFIELVDCSSLSDKKEGILYKLWNVRGFNEILRLAPNKNNREGKSHMCKY